jgi:beta-glucosidase/6-phospho-beta-glucosidase/beta-galactosidase
MVIKNESWSFAKDFWWDVASAAYQVECAAKDEGRGGHSIWSTISFKLCKTPSLHGLLKIILLPEYQS